MKTNGFAMELMKKKDLLVVAKVVKKSLDTMRELKVGRIQI